MSAYLGFNVALYAAQLALYIVFLLTSPANVATLVSALYLFLSCVDLAVPVAIFALITYVRCSLSGFPVSPSHQERAEAIARVAVVWTLARLLWGVVALAAVIFVRRPARFPHRRRSRPVRLTPCLRPRDGWRRPCSRSGSTRSSSSPCSSYASSSHTRSHSEPTSAACSRALPLWPRAPATRPTLL